MISVTIYCTGRISVPWVASCLFLEPGFVFDVCVCELRLWLDLDGCAVRVRCAIAEGAGVSAALVHSLSQGTV